MSSKGPALIELDKHKQLSTKYCVNIVLDIMLGQRRRSWTNINFKQALGHP